MTEIINIDSIIKKLAKKFDLKESDFTSFNYQGKTAIVQLHNTKYYGSYNDIWAKPKKDFEIRVGNKRYDTRSFMTEDLYRAFMKHCQETKINPMPDSSELSVWTLTWFTGEKPVEKYGGSCVPLGYWRVDQVKSYLYWAGREYNDVRVRLAMIVDNNSEHSPSSKSLSLQEVTDYLLDKGHSVNKQLVEDVMELLS